MQKVGTIWKWLSWICFYLGLYFLFTLVLIMVSESEWDYVITVNNPKRRMAAVFVFWSVWFYTFRGDSPLNGCVMKTARLMLLCVSLAFSLLAAEVFLRLALNSRNADVSLEKLARYQEDQAINLRSFHPLAAIVKLSPNRQIVYELIPGLDRVFGHSTLRTNRDGMRASRDYDVPKPSGVMRILGIGDSGMFGWNVDQDVNYMSVLERLLSGGQSGVRYEVLNLAVPGYNTQQEVEMLRHKGLRYEPDIVIVGWCDNDFGPPFFMVPPVDYRRRDVSFFYNLVFNREAFYHLTRPDQAALRSSEADIDFVDPSIVEYTGVDGVGRAFGELQELAERHNFRILVFGPMNSHAVGVMKDLNMDYFNTHELIPKDKYPKDFAVHFMHPGPDGHGALGFELCDFLKKNDWLREE